MDVASKLITISGIATTLVGVLLLFRYGMPYRIETRGEIGISWDDVDSDALAKDKTYRARGWLGLGLVVIGGILQAIGVWVA